MASAVEMGFPAACEVKGRRAMWDGWAHVQAVLYVGVLMATQRNPVTRILYQRLCQAGMVKTLTWMACMRKRHTM
jgi:transposase